MLVIERATALVEELGVELDRQLRSERRPGERLRMLREATNRITRAANDAIQAYIRARRLVELAAERDRASHGDAEEMRERLSAARTGLLGAIAVAARRYPPPKASGGPEPGDDDDPTGT